ncbi:flagellar hook-basal body complex protein [Thermosulfurimonas marina]|uniref:Flagellar hook protein FlgE n=1 Tax=Thermosulfurimonas marina TaxID=2047767 RepID=A0A6H1WUD2_9BACT|nr:flagellar hook-basal body complex protein [Thermosulfurimonas marina]QJA06807.1 flagellar hook-basal body complex protein [Thermosulfurimonas marina]
MALTDALFTGTSGLKSLGHGMSVVGDNVANLNTTAFKGSRVTFQDVMAQSINTASGSGQLGRGATVQALYPTFGQGSFESTASPTDLAIAGNGFFMVKEPGSTGNIFYTRDGQFTVDKNGYLINPSGFRVQGWQIDENTGDITGAITDIRIDRTSAPVATSKIDVITNLDAREELETLIVNLNGDVDDGSTVSTTFVVRDVDGNDNKLYVELTYDAGLNKWNYVIRKDNATGPILAQGTNASTTRATVELPTTGENIIVDWSAVTHTTSADTLSAPGRLGRVEVNGDITPDTWNYLDYTLTDANGNTRNLRLWLYYDSGDSRWDYYVVENPTTPAPADPTGEGGTILAQATNIADTDTWFFLDGTTQRVNLDWSAVTTGGTGSLNLAASYPLQEVPTLLDRWDARNETPLASTEYTYRTTLTVYDSLGTPHEITIYYDTTTKENTYEFLVTCNPSEDQRDFVRDADPMQWVDQEGSVTVTKDIPSGSTYADTKRGVLMYGRLSFDNQGNVKNFYETYRIDANTGVPVKIVGPNGVPVADPADGFEATGANGYPLLIADFLGIDLVDNRPAGSEQDQGTNVQALQQIEMNFGYYYKDSWRSESVRTTQYATSNSTIFYDQNGFGPGSLETVSVDTDGVITGHYSNGRVIPLWMVALANFNAPERLDKVGGNLYRETTGSGPPITGKPRTNGLGSIAPNSLEQSNVDLGEQFVKMIIFQRGFQADARIITVTDTMLDELINLKR